MREPSLRTSRLAIAGALAAACLVTGMGFYLGRTTATDAAREGPGNRAPIPIQAPAVSTIVANSFLDRADVIELAAAAADATASGEALPDRVRNAVGRRVEIALPFGCSGPAEADSEQPLRWRYDEGAETLRLHVAVTPWEPDEWNLDQPTGDGAIEGFWIARPWSARDECPQPAGRGPSSAPATDLNAERSLAVAQFFRGDARREALREGRPLQSVQRLSRADPTPGRGFRLMLSGRIDRVPGVQGGVSAPVHCIQPGGIERRPRCIVAVTLDEVRIENPASRTVLASWPMGRD